MTTTVEVTKEDINFYNANVLISAGGEIVLSTPSGLNEEAQTFKGVILYNPNNQLLIGKYKETLNVSDWSLIPASITITYTND